MGQSKLEKIANMEDNLRKLLCTGMLILFSLTTLSSCRSVEHSLKGNMAMMENGYLPHTDMSGNDILPRCLKHIATAENLQNQLVKDASVDGILRSLNLYNDILVNIDVAISQSSLLSQVHPDEKVRKDAESCEQKASSFMTDLSLNQAVFQALLMGENTPLDVDAKRLLERTLRDFRRSGVDKDDATRAKIKKLRDELVTIGQEFGQNIRDERFVINLDSKDLKGMPADYVSDHKAGADGKIEISTDYPDYIPFMKYADSNKARQELRFKYLNRGQKNGPILKSMIDKRNELAQLLNYSSYADYVVEDKMIKEAKSIHSFIDKISKISKAGADKEYAAMLKFKQKTDKKAKAIYGYESGYIEEAFKKDKFKFDSQSVRPYFSYNKVRDGLLAVTSKLFNIHYVPITDAKVWHGSVLAYDVFDESAKLGRIYLDMHPREGKYKHAAQFTVLSGLKDRQYPEGALVCNFPNPKDGDGSALMEHREVVTMFHEFGHLLHHVFAGQQQWMPFSGVATEWDFVEAPSQLLEEWAWSSEVLAMFANHYQTGAVIPADLVKKMRAADEFGKAISARQQMFYAALSADYFDKDPKSFDLEEHLKQLQSQYSYFPYEEGTHFQNSFGHLDGYSAMYYTYMWSLSIAKDLLEPFQKAGLMNQKIAKKYRDTILKQGGAKDAQDLVQEFLGRPFRFDAFEKWLKTDPLATSRS